MKLLRTSYLLLIEILSFDNNGLRFTWDMCTTEDFFFGMITF